MEARNDDGLDLGGLGNSKEWSHAWYTMKIKPTEWDIGLKEKRRIKDDSLGFRLVQQVNGGISNRNGKDCSKAGLKGNLKVSFQTKWETIAI